MDDRSLGGKVLVADQKDASTKKRRMKRDSRKDDQSPGKDSKSSLGSKKRGREDSEISDEEEQKRVRKLDEQMVEAVSDELLLAGPANRSCESY